MLSISIFLGDKNFGIKGGGKLKLGFDVYAPFPHTTLLSLSLSLPTNTTLPAVLCSQFFSFFLSFFL